VNFLDVLVVGFEAFRIVPRPSTQIKGDCLLHDVLKVAGHIIRTSESRRKTRFCSSELVTVADSL
jgi:hypothetical protein